jgi:hypothetical protein
MERPTKIHLVAAKRILKYLKGTLNLGILCRKCELHHEFKIWSNSNYTGDLDDRKSISRYVFIFDRKIQTW